MGLPCIRRCWWRRCDYAKQRVISKSALYYMTVNGIDEIPCRFDVVSIEDDRIILYQNAFDYVEI